MRRPALQVSLFLAILGTTFASEFPCYRVGVCDWMILKRQELGAFPVAREFGAAGVEVDMGSLGNRPTTLRAHAQPTFGARSILPPRLRWPVRG
jgi:hypothetical protein